MLRRLEIPLLFLAVLAGSVALASVAPVYFRQDDVGYLKWAATATSPLEAFHPDTGTLFSMFRPTINLWWMALYDMFELRPEGYQILLAGAYGTALVFWWLALKKLESATFAVTTIIAWVLCFYYLQYLIFWFSAFVYVLQTLFMMIAFHGAVRWFRQRSWIALIQVGIAHLLAVLTKEPAALILPAIYGSLILREIQTSGFPNPARLRGMIGLITMSIAGIGWVLFKPGLVTRAGLATAFQDGSHWEFVAGRWNFYSSFLTSGAGPLLWIATTVLLISASRHSRGLTRAFVYLTATLVTAGIVMTQFNAGIALLILFLGLGIICFIDLKARLGALWFVPPVLCLHIIDFQVRTYLIEASFGAALVMGYAFAPAVARASARLSAFSPGAKIASGIFAFVLIVTASTFMSGQVLAKWEALRTVSAVRTQFAGMVHHIRSHNIAPVIIPDYEDMGMHYGRDVLALEDLSKSRIQKPMESGEVRLLLQLAAPPEIEVISWENWQKRKAEFPRPVLLLMTQHEIDWFTSFNLPHDILTESSSTRSASRLLILK